MHPCQLLARSFPIAARAVLAALALVAGIPAAANRGGAPVCEIDIAGMSTNMGASSLSSPNGWSLQGPSSYSSGSPITVSLFNGNASMQFRGLLLWATTAGAGGLGSWVLDDQSFRNSNGCPWSLTHASAGAKSQRSFTFTPPAAGTGPLLFHAFVVEECGESQCMHNWIEAGKFLVPEATVTPPTANHTALWWNPAESGWGLNLNQQGDTIFGTLFTYDAQGAPMWLVMSGGVLQPGGSIYSGALYRTTGPPFNASPFPPITTANITTVGTMSVNFSSTSSASLTYTVNGAPVTKIIQPQVYGTRAASCATTAGSRTALTNYQDLWWNPSESGWGVNVTHQDNTLFATLFTYDASGKGLWLVMSAGAKQADGSFLGDLYQTTGSAFNAQPFVPLAAANVTKVGTMQFRFADGNSGTLAYTLNGIAETKTITRQVFSTPVPACS